jgi:hypothetical protein
VSTAHTAGRTQGFRNVFDVLPGQAYTLEELVHLASVRIGNLRQGECFVKIGRRPCSRIRTLHVADGWARPEHVARVTAALAAETPYITALPRDEPRRAPVVRLVPDQAVVPLGPASAVHSPKDVEDDWG